MARPHVTQALRGRVIAAAKERCDYCLTSQSFTAMPLHVEHIIPIAVGGPTTEENLWLACPLCNGYKGNQTHGTDPENGD